MNPEKRGCYTIKTYQNYLYTWCPDNQIKKRGNPAAGGNAKKFCNAIPYSQGEDWICKYVADTIMQNNEQRKLAYVACDYVK